MRILLFLTLLHGLFAVPIQAQQDSTEVVFDKAPLVIKRIETEDLEKYRADEAFNYEISKAERTWWDDFKTWLGNLFLRIFESIFGVEKAVGFLNVFLRIVPYLLLGVLIFLLIKFFLNVNSESLRQAQNNKSFVAISEEEHIIKNEDIKELIRKALATKNYRLAIRYYYLYMLKSMSEKELISWQLQKTNADYLQEIKNAELKQYFTKITHLYDYIWYGDFPIDEIRYRKAEKVFLQLQKIVLGNG